MAERTGIDGVFLGHIKGQWLYADAATCPTTSTAERVGSCTPRGRSAPTTATGTASGWCGSTGAGVTTDTVPIFVPGGIRIEGAGSVRPGKRSLYEAFGKQPVFNDPAKVEALELRDPDPVRPVQGGGMGAIGGFVRDGGGRSCP